MSRRYRREQDGNTNDCERYGTTNTEKLLSERTGLALASPSCRLKLL